MSHLYRCEDCCHVINGAPLILEDVQADGAICIDCRTSRRSGRSLKTIKELSRLAREVEGSLFGWNILDLNFTTGALFGYSSVNSSVSLKVPGGTMVILNNFRSTEGHQVSRNLGNICSYRWHRTHRHPTACPRARK